MNYRTGVLTGVLFTLLVVGGGVGVWWFVGPKPLPSANSPPASAPATVAKPLKEDQINTITLTPEAIARLALGTGLVERKAIRRARVYGGEVTIPPGQAITVSSPLSGTIKSPSGATLQPGRAVTKGQQLFQLLPLLTPEGRANLSTSKVEADGQVKSAQTQLDAARIALDRAKRLFASEAGSRRAVEEAQALFDLAEKALAAATARRDLLEKVAGQAEAGTAGPLSIECPEDGQLRNVWVLPGQNVPAGAALFEVVNLSRVWVRVPVYVGDLPAVDAAADASVGNLTASAGDPTQPASPVAAPPTANPAAGTVDLFYELDNRAVKYSPGQRVGVSLFLISKADSLTTAWAAVIHDIHGGTWVYEQAGERTFVRRRVVVRYVVGETAVLAAGPAPGAQVVTAGAAELFGAETGFTK